MDYPIVPCAIIRHVSTLMTKIPSSGRIPDSWQIDVFPPEEDFGNVEPAF